MKGFFSLVAEVVQEQSPATAEKLRRASPHWMRQTHTPRMRWSAECTLLPCATTFRHASLSITSTYLHADEAKRARQLREAFTGQRR